MPKLQPQAISAPNPASVAGITAAARRGARLTMDLPGQGPAVSISLGRGSLLALRAHAAGSRVLLLTSEGWCARGIVERIRETVTPSSLTVVRVPSHPGCAQLAEICKAVARSRFDVTVAVGGGSVLDAAKISAATVTGQSGKGRLRKNVRSTVTGAWQSQMRIAIPTTAGSSSELTRWATVWDYERGEKRSIVLPAVWPTAAIYDPELHVSLPWQVTLEGGLDCLAHCLDVLWHSRAGGEAVRWATEAASEVLDALPRLRLNQQSVELRTRLVSASIGAGFAFSTTETSIAHTLSYFLTLRLGVHHGIACGLMLPYVADAVKQAKGSCEDRLRIVLGDAPGDKLRAFLAEVGLDTSLASYGLCSRVRQEMKALVARSSRRRNCAVDPITILDSFPWQQG